MTKAWVLILALLVGLAWAQSDLLEDKSWPQVDQEESEDDMIEATLIEEAESDSTTPAPPTPAPTTPAPTTPAPSTPTPTPTPSSPAPSDSGSLLLPLAQSQPPCEKLDEAEIRTCLRTFKFLGNEKYAKSKKTYRSYNVMCDELFNKQGEKMFLPLCQEIFPKYFPQGPTQLKDQLKDFIPEVLCFEAVKKARGGKINERCKQVTATEKPRCVFFHGVGERHEDVSDASIRHRHPSHVMREFDEYWGKLHKKLENVCEPLFFWTETRKRGWDDKTLVKEYCSVIDVLYPTVIFTHSMGNLVVANGMAHEMAGCNRISKYDPLSTISWYGIQGPLRGAPGNILLKRFCKKFENSKFVTNKLLKRCIDGGLMEPAYASMVPDFRAPDSIGQLLCPKNKDFKCRPLLYIASTFQRGSMCGLSPRSGLSLKTDIGLTILAWKTHFEVKNDPDWDSDKMKYPTIGNDGMVSFSSCRALDARGQPFTYSEDPEWNYYALNGNHGDGTCRFGDGKHKDKQPCTWILNMVNEAINIWGQAKAKAVLAASQKPKFRQLEQLHLLTPMLH